MKKPHRHPNATWADLADAEVLVHITESHSEVIPAQTVATDQMRLCAVPFFARDVSLGDIVTVNGRAEMTGIARRSGYITFRVVFRGVDREIRRHLTRLLEDKGGKWEWHHDGFLSFAVRIRKDAREFVSLLDDLERDGKLNYEYSAFK